MRRIFVFILGAMLGGMLGSMLVLLLTPMPGQSIRDRIQQFFDQLNHDVRQAAADRRIELEKQLAQLRGEVISE